MADRSELVATKPPPSTSPVSQTSQFNSISTPDGCFPFTNIKIPDSSPFTNTAERFLARYPPPQPAKRKRPSGSKSCGRPRKEEKDLKRPRYDPRAKATKLRKSNPVVTRIPTDVWCNIFVFTEPRTLIALKSTCHAFREILSAEGMWKENRLFHFGARCPPPPLFPPNTQFLQKDGQKEPRDRIKESYYIELIEGQGCMACSNKKAARTQWAFLFRLCNKCYKEEIIQGDGMKIVVAKHADLLSLVPLAWNNSWGSYCEVVANTLSNSLMGTQNLGCRKRDLKAIISEFETLTSSDPYLQAGAEDRQKIYRTWRDGKAMLVDEYLSGVQLVEEFVDLLKDDERYFQSLGKEALALRRLRFFEAKARKMDPPLSPRAFKLIPGFADLISGKHEPTERAWNCFQPKVEQYRDMAEEQASKDDFIVSLNPALAALRAGYAKAEFMWNTDREPRPMLYDFADQVIVSCQEAKVAPEDFTYLVLKGVWEKYQASSEKPRANEWDLVRSQTDDYYKLCLLDALVVFKKKINPVIRRWPAIDRTKGLHHKCPACLRSDYSKAWRFKSLLLHLRKVHGPEIGSVFGSWHMTALDYVSSDISVFPWHAIAWPRNLPILSSHQSATGQWDPDDDSYVQAPLSKPKATLSAFDGRGVRLAPAPSSDTLLADDMASNILDVLEQLNDAPIEKGAKVKIAWEYACQNFEKLDIRKAMAVAESSEMKDGEGEINPDDVLEGTLAADNETLSELALALFRSGKCSPLDGLSCRSCATSTDGHTHPRWVNGKISFHELVNHWKDFHVLSSHLRHGRWIGGQLIFHNLVINGIRDPRTAPGSLPLSPRAARASLDRTGRLKIHRNADWRTDMLLIPSDYELADALGSHRVGDEKYNRCMENTRRIFDTLFPQDSARSIPANSEISTRASSTDSSPSSVGNSTGSRIEMAIVPGASAASHPAIGAIDGLQVLANEAAKVQSRR